MAHKAVCICGLKAVARTQADAMKVIQQHKCPVVKVGLEREGWDIPPAAA